MIGSDALPQDFLGAQVAFGLYVVLVLGVTLGLTALGLPGGVAVLALLAVGALLLVPFWPLFERLHPEHDNDSGR